MVSPGTFRIAPDGSFAAIVPARKPLTWQLVDPNRNGVVRERVWVTSSRVKFGSVALVTALIRATRWGGMSRKIRRRRDEVCYRI